MCAAQSLTDIEILMYYDARPCAYNGLFDFYTKEPLKGYYPFKMFNELYKMGKACECVIEGASIYSSAAKDDNGNSAVMLCLYTDDDTDTLEKEIKLRFIGGKAEYDIYLLDAWHTDELIGKVSAGQTITIKPNSVVLLK